MLQPTDTPSEMPAIPGVPGSGLVGLKQRLDAQKHGYQSGSSGLVEKMKAMLGGMQQQQSINAPVPKQVEMKTIGNERRWRV